MYIEPIQKNQQLVQILDELKYALRYTSSVRSSFCREFDILLTKFIQRWHLDKDQHNFASGEPSLSLDYTGTHCSVCGESQFKTPSGIVCSNGHGGAPSKEDEIED